MINCLYINLDHRIDRNKEMISQFNDISNQINLQRFSAIYHKPGFIGCTKSHIKCIEHAKEMKWEYVVILEDDFELIVSPQYFLNKINEVLTKSWDVMMLSGVIYSPVIAFDGIAKVSNVQTSAGYIIRARYYDVLLQNFNDGLKLLSNNYNNYSLYALDQYWKILQQKDKWYISVPILGKQRSGFSDIEQIHVNYDVYFLDSTFNKEHIHNLT